MHVSGMYSPFSCLGTNGCNRCLQPHAPGHLFPVTVVLSPAFACRPLRWTHPAWTRGRDPRSGDPAARSHVGSSLWNVMCLCVWGSRFLSLYRCLLPSLTLPNALSPATKGEMMRRLKVDEAAFGQEFQGTDFLDFACMSSMPSTPPADGVAAAAPSSPHHDSDDDERLTQRISSSFFFPLSLQSRSPSQASREQTLKPCFMTFSVTGSYCSSPCVFTAGLKEGSDSSKSHLQPLRLLHSVHQIITSSG